MRWIFETLFNVLVSILKNTWMEYRRKLLKREKKQCVNSIGDRLLQQIDGRLHFYDWFWGRVSVLNI